MNIRGNVMKLVSNVSGDPRRSNFMSGCTSKKQVEVVHKHSSEKPSTCKTTSAPKKNISQIEASSCFDLTKTPELASPYQFIELTPPADTVPKLQTPIVDLSVTQPTNFCTKECGTLQKPLSLKKIREPSKRSISTDTDDTRRILGLHNHKCNASISLASPTVQSHTEIKDVILVPQISHASIAIRDFLTRVAYQDTLQLHIPTFNRDEGQFSVTCVIRGKLYTLQRDYFIVYIFQINQCA